MSDILVGKDDFTVLIADEDMEIFVREEGDFEVTIETVGVNELAQVRELVDQATAAASTVQYTAQSLSASQQAQARANIGAAGSPSVSGLSGANNAGMPTTMMDFAAARVVLVDANGNTVLRTNTGTVHNFIGVVGAGGRDQAGAFSSGSWIHFYWIWNGTTLSTVSSTTAPPTGPTLPSGYTHWAYIGAVYLDGSGNLMRVAFAGSMVFYSLEQSLVAAGTATTETVVPLTAHVPPNALSMLLRVTDVNVSGSGANLVLRVITGVNYVNLFVTNGGRVVTQIRAPNLGRFLAYLHSTTNMTLTLDINGYQVPNGGE